MSEEEINEKINLLQKNKKTIEQIYTETKEIEIEENILLEVIT